MMRFGKTSKPGRQVTVRLTWSIIDALSDEAGEKGITLSEVIRNILDERMLQGGRLEETRLTVLRMDKELKMLRKELGVATEVILGMSGTISKEEAHDLVAGIFGRRV